MNPMNKNANWWEEMYHESMRALERMRQKHACESCEYNEKCERRTYENPPARYATLVPTEEEEVGYGYERIEVETIE